MSPGPTEPTMVVAAMVAVGTIPGLVLGVAALLFGAWGFVPRGYPFLKLHSQGGGTSKAIGGVVLLVGLALLGISFYGEALMGRR